MDTAALHAPLQALEEKVKRLLAKTAQLQAENKRLRQNSPPAPTDKSAQIDQYIQKIDHCIAYFEQLR